MNCDVCDKHIEEDDTHEHILCSACYDSEKKRSSHCMLCHGKLIAKNMFTYIGSVLKKQRKFLLVLGCIFGVVGLMIPFWPLVALKIAIGLIGVPITLALLLGLFALLFPGAWDLGLWIGEKFNWDVRDTDDFIPWLVGTLAYSIPFIAYGIGAVVYHIFFTH